MNDVRWGFLGAGMVATAALAPAVHAARGAVLAGAAARDRTRAQALGPQRTYDSYARLLDAPDIDAVYISLSNDAHLPWTLAALQSGKHVLCEKPLALTADEVDQAARASAASSLLVVEASWYRWHPRVRLAQQHLPSLGPVRHVAAGFSFLGALEGNYRLDPARGGGALYDVGCYAASACLWAVGQGPPLDVCARAETGPTGVDLETRAILRWEGAQAELVAGVGAAGGQHLVITGDDGEIELRDRPFTSWRDDTTQLWLSDGRGTTRLSVPPVDAYQVMVEEVSSVLRGGPGWVLPLAESRQTAAVLDAARASAAAGGAPVALA